jgi:hypothetical protein
MTEAQKQIRRDRKNQKGNTTMNSFLMPPSNNNANNNSVEGADESSMADTDNDVAVTFSDNTNTSIRRAPRPVIANLDAEDDEDDDGYDSDGEGGEGAEAMGTEKGIQQEYLQNIHQQLKDECNFQRGKQDGDWLVQYLKDNGWWIRKESAPRIAKKLSLPVYHYTYYRDVRVWIPDLQYGKDCMPSCPCCKSKSRVTIHGFQPKHYGRIVVGLAETYYIISRRYRCEGCREKNEALKRSIRLAFQSGSVVEIEKSHQYTFMAWNDHSLPLLPRSLSLEFPAFLTHKSGIDKEVLNIMFPLINKGVRPQAISDMLLELHSKKYTSSHIRYEQDNQHLRQYGRGYAEYSEFDNEYGYRGKVPTGGYLQSVYIKYHRTIRTQLENEVKKRGGEMYSMDVSYKSAKHMCNYKGEPVFKGLVTVTNEFGEIRMQFHVVSDSHEQMVAAFESFLKTTKEYGYPPMKLMFTDNPARDKAFLLNMFPSLQEHQMKMDLFDAPEDVSTETRLPLLPYDADKVTVLSKTAEINRYVNAMRNMIKDTTNSVAIDAEWKVDLTSTGRVKRSHKIGLIQFCFLDINNNYNMCLVQTGKLKRLPSALEAFFRDDTIAIVGVQVGGDLAKIGRDFDLSKVVNERREGSVINLGGFARERDVVQNGKVGLDVLCEAILKHRIEKQPHLRFSNWDDPKLSVDQIKYAALDSLASFQIYEAIKSLPNLHSRLNVEDAAEGKRVDVVPRTGGSISCMATRAATGTIVASTSCGSPDGILPTNVKPGAKHVVVRIETVYSPSMKVPRYKMSNGGVVTIGAFRNCNVVLPVTMLKEHVESDAIRSTPESAEQQLQIGVTAPASSNGKPPRTSAAGTKTTQEQDNDDDAAEDQDVSYSITEIEDFGEVTTIDCDMLRCAIFCAGEYQSGRSPISCENLDQAPNPDSIQNKFSAALGDVFHAMDRPNIPVKHEAKKGYKNALKNAFFIWNESQMNELVRRMKDAGMDDDEIESAKYFRPTIFHDCVERIVPPPKVLYWRVRAVFALYGMMRDSKTNAPLFNDKSWKKANNVLREILEGYYSDPPGVAMYRKKISGDGSIVKNKYEMDVIECLRGTNGTEAVHKGLASVFGGWNMGVEMSSYVLAWYRHCYNHRCSEKKRLGFPVIGHFDTWLVDLLQNLVYKNHGRLLYPDWTNASDYKATDESFGTNAIHSQQLHDALTQRWDALSEEEKAKVNLTSDQKFLCQEMNVPLPFLPFATTEEYAAYNEFIVNGMPTDDEAAAVEWCKNVDGINKFPKLPVHLRSYRERWERNQRVKDSVRRAKSGSEKLKELNAVIIPPPDPRPNVAQQNAIIPVCLPMIPTQALAHEPYPVVAQIGIREVPIDTPRKSMVGVRGKDKQKRNGKRCRPCITCNGPEALTCRGRGGAMLCPNFCSICIDDKNCANTNAAICPGRHDRSQCDQLKKQKCFRY